MGLPIPPPGPGGGISPLVDKLPEASLTDPLLHFTPVTDETLRDPQPGDWLTWRRTYDDTGFSPLKQINRSNVGTLHVAWAFSLPNGPNEGTPLVHDGVLFLQSYGDRVQAFDAATGDILWQYARELPQGITIGVKRNISIYGNLVLLATSDSHLVALNVKNGHIVWDHEVADYKEFRMTGGPLVVKGKVIIGTVGRAPGGDYIAAFDTETGNEAWRFYTIARPGEPGGDSWNGLPLEKRNGASVWTAGSYDSALNLVFFGPGQTYDTGPLLHPVHQPGITTESLYTDTTLALNPDTGKLAWFFQHVPNDQWDLDWAFEREVIKVPVGGVEKKLVVTGGKVAIFDALDAETGKYAFSIDLGLQNVFTAIDPKTGAKAVNPEVVPGDGKPHTVCPHAGGARNWLATSYNAETGNLYVPLVENCMDLIPSREGDRTNLSTGVHWALRPRPGSDGKYGRVEAINLKTRKVVWTDRQRAPITTAMLATAGGIVFGGSFDRWIRAYDDSNGNVLWETRLNDVPNSCPITYSVNGKQYVAVVVGNGASLASTWPVLVPEIHNPPDRSSTLWVFELPEKDAARNKAAR